MTRKFSLRWIDFHTNLYQSLEAFLESEELVDVTLAAGGQYFRAHKLILSICSPFFKELFKKNPCAHPIVILKNVEHLELFKLLQFIYRGEVHVTQQELNPFLETAEFLQIKGLASVRGQSEPPTDESDENQETNKNTNTSLDSQSECNPRKENKTNATEASIDCVSESIQKECETSSLKSLFENTSDDDICSIEKKARTDYNSSIHNENVKETKVIETTVDTNVCNNKSETAKYSGLNKKQRTTSVNCEHCHRSFANRYNLKVHIKDKHETEQGTLKCHKCHKFMRNPSCLRVHMYQHHK